MRPMRLAVSLIALTALTAGCVGSGPSAADVSKHVKAQIQGRGAVHGERLLEPRTLASFYKDRGYRRAWDPGDADDVIAAIHDIERDGLTPADYHLEAIGSLIEARKEKVTPAGDADLDILLSDAVAGMIDHVRYGRVHPVDLNPSWNVDPRAGTPPIAEELTKAVAAGSVRDAIQHERPDHFIYRGLVDALARLREIEAKGGWPSVPAGRAIKPGTSSPRIPAVRARLVATGELSGGDPKSTLYDPALRKAVELFQARHRLDADGVIDANLVDAMNVSVASRIDQVRINLERARWVVGGLADDFMLVNLPAFKAYLIRGGRVDWESRTQVGDEAKQTPTFRADMKTVVFNPDWTVPPMIIAEEVLQGMRKDAGYLASKHLVVTDRSNQEVDPGSIDWNSATPEDFPYTIRQPAGDDNALGHVKFLFPNPYSVYLHDTPSRTLFDAEQRTFSHGCIRLEHPLDLAERLLAGQDGWNRSKIEQVVASGETQNVNLEHSIPVLIVYWTVSVGASGEIRYMRDFYGLDPSVLASLGGRTGGRRPASPA